MVIQRSDDPDAFSDFERSGWDTVSEGYDQHFTELTRQSVEAMLEAARVGPGTRMLDVCSGPGMLAEAAVRRGAEAVGIDFSDAVVEIARRKVPDAEFHRGDAQALPFDDASYDAVVCGYGVIHVPDPKRALVEMRRVLRPSGRVAISVWEAPRPSNGFGLLFGAIKEHGNLEVALPAGPDFFQFSEGDALTRALADVGFGEVSATRVEQLWALTSPVAIVRAIQEGAVRARALLLAQTDAVRSAIESTVRAGMKRYETDGNRYAVPMPAIVGAGTK